MEEDEKFLAPEIPDGSKEPDPFWAEIAWFTPIGRWRAALCKDGHSLRFTQTTYATNTTKYFRSKRRAENWARKQLRKIRAEEVRINEPKTVIR